MWLKALGVLVVAAVAAISFALTSGSDVGIGSSSGPGLTVSPVIGDAATTFAFDFRAPDASGSNGGTRLGYTLGIVGPSGSGCVGSRSAQVPDVSKGAEVSVTVGPTELGDPWCPGTYNARVSEFATPVCAPGTMCPQFIRVVGTVGRTSFRVRVP